MSFIKTETVVTKTFNDWGVWSANTYINSSGGYGTGDSYWQVKAPIDVSYEASVGGSFTITGMTYFESNRTYVNFFSADVDTIKRCTTSNANNYRISTTYINTQNQVISVPSTAKSMMMSVRTINPNEIATVNVALRQIEVTWNTIDDKEPHSGIYDFDGVTNYVIGKVYDYDGTTNSPIGKVYDYDGTTSYLIYSALTDLIVNGAVQSALGSLTLLNQQYSSALTYSGDYVHLQNRNSGSVSRVDSSAQIEWSQYSTMKIELGASDLRYCDAVAFVVANDMTVPTYSWIWHTKTADWEQKVFGYKNPNWANGTILTLDVSDCNTKGIFYFGARGNVGNLYIKNIWLE